LVIEALGLCSPSRKVVSKMMSLSVMAVLSIGRGVSQAALEQNERPAACAGGPLIGVQVFERRGSALRQLWIGGA
jgi:hypothetical protein